jgi:Tetratricopeptide repeat
MKKQILCAVALAFALIASARAEWITLATTPIPVDRLVANLEARLEREPANVSVLVNLARLHAYAFAAGATSIGQTKDGTLPDLEPHDFDMPARSVNGAITAERRRHLDRAISRYREALRLDREHLVARLGLAWCLEQNGSTTEAIAEYRTLIDLAWPRERASEPTTARFKPYVVEEAGNQLIALLGTGAPEEVQRVRALVNEAAGHGRRAITPIAVPLERTWLPGPQPASALFDADGSGLQRRWSWIDPGAAWLVHDNNHGTIDSALQLFGNVTFWMFWDNGYEALCALDDSGDGVLTLRELDHLAPWRDLDADGVSDAGEVAPLDRYGITALSCGHPVVNDEDDSVAAYEPEGVRFADGTVRRTYDLLLHVVQPPHVSRLTTRYRPGTGRLKPATTNRSLLDE